MAMAIQGELDVSWMMRFGQCASDDFLRMICFRRRASDDGLQMMCLGKCVMSRMAWTRDVACRRLAMRERWTDGLGSDGRDREIDERERNGQKKRETD